MEAKPDAGRLIPRVYEEWLEKLMRAPLPYDLPERYVIGERHEVAMEQSIDPDVLDEVCDRALRGDFGYLAESVEPEPAGPVHVREGTREYPALWIGGTGSSTSTTLWPVWTSSSDISVTGTATTLGGYTITYTLRTD